MKTDISAYCEEYEQVLRPFAAAVQKTIGEIRHAKREATLQPVVHGLADAYHRLEALRKKMDGQEAYLLIFGPLKSGKSTLMNAIAGMYVSEVTSMPAYPCLVYVRNGEKQEFAVTRYNGSHMSFTDNGALQTIIADSHSSLAEHLRAVEGEGRSFDPAIDYAEAIRRVDIQLPIPNLAESSTVLVDTPGLYSRMKFGYDLMTREFRDSAASAIFVVKTDNLFLEQVFAEFTQLLDLFSRIFLVVNVDIGKRDLRPDGTLRPSLESEEPERIIKAFEDLAMSEPLRRAFEDGRLRIYPMDLLSAARDILTEKHPDASDETDETDESRDLERSSEDASESAEDSDSGFGSDSDSDSDAADFTAETDPNYPLETHGTELEEAAPARPPRATFNQFLDDLAEYLNSNEYLVEFMRDGLRQGRVLREHVQDCTGAERLGSWRAAHDSQTERLHELEEKLSAIGELQAADLPAAFERVNRENERQTGALAKSIVDETSSTLFKAIDQWLESDESLLDLEQKHWRPIMRKSTERMVDETRKRIGSLVDTAYGGAELSLKSIGNLNMLGISAASIRRAVLDRIGPGLKPDAADLKIPDEVVPVKKSFVDYILFRSQASVRRRLFGPSDDLSRPIPHDTKRKRLGPEATQALSDLAADHLKAKLPALAQRCSSEVMAEYIELFGREMNQQITVQQKQIAADKNSVESELESDKHVFQALETLESAVAGFANALDEVDDRYELQPPPEPEPEPEPDAESEPQSESESESEFAADSDDDDNDDDQEHGDDESEAGYEPALELERRFDEGAVAEPTLGPDADDTADDSNLNTESESESDSEDGEPMSERDTESGVAIRIDPLANKPADAGMNETAEAEGDEDDDEEKAKNPLGEDSSDEDDSSTDPTLRADEVAQMAEEGHGGDESDEKTSDAPAPRPS